MREFTHARLWQVILLGLVLGCDPYDYAEDAPTCVTVAHTRKSLGIGVDKLDLLFVVDNSPSMAQEQAALARELPKLVTLLMTGERPSTDEWFYPRRDLHIGVISADLGVSGSAATLAGCSRRGDDAQLQQGRRGADCAESYPAFLAYYAPERPLHPLIPQPGVAMREVIAEDLGCMAQLGSAGCAVRQPLEAALQALSPGGAHADFLRNDPEGNFAELQIVLISDGDDCSVRYPALFDEAARAAPNAVSAVCAERGELLQDLSHFANALRALKPYNTGDVWFSAITGIPANFQDPAELAVPGFYLDDEERRVHFARVLADPRMQPKRRADGTLEPVCENERASATPAPRLVELALRLGGLADVRSICDPDWFRALVPAQSVIVERLSSNLECLRRFERRPDGLAPCRVIWELELPGSAWRGSPTHCSDLPFLTPVAGQPRTPLGHELCEVHQLLYRGDHAPPELESGGGWFYDESSGDNRQCLCRRPEGCSRILFMPDNPPPGVRITLQCQETRCTTPGCDPSECRVPG